MTTTLLWFRQDLRLHDHAALVAAVKRGGPVVPVYVFDEEGEGSWPPGAASRWWLHHSLVALDVALREHGSRLTVARGRTQDVFSDLIERTGATAVYWSRRYEPAAAKTERELAANLASRGVDARGFEGALLFDPETVRNRQGQPFQVFSPFWRHCLTLPVSPPLKAPAGTWAAPKSWPTSLPIESLELLPRKGWDAEFGAHWQPGEAGARKRARSFVRDCLAKYDDARDRPGVAGTSALSPHLHFGEITARQIWSAIRLESTSSGVFPPNKGAAVYLKEIGWREFAHHLLVHFPHTPERPLRAAFERFPWASDPGNLRWEAWTRGRTGYPIVDAGMRQLWRTGWMHNRVRMIVASFLVKHLRLPWTKGAAWFWDTLVDADLANNTLGWQWSAGCGADAAPYFRIFAPVTQGERYDATGEYVRRWVPELAKLPDPYLHAPWTAPAQVLERADVRFGTTYPLPIVDHAKARAEALAAFKSLRAEAGP